MMEEGQQTRDETALKVDDSLFDEHYMRVVHVA